MENLIENLMEIFELVKLGAIIFAFIFLIAVTIHQAITGEWFGLSEKVRYPWEKEERKKAKEAEKKAREKKWYEY